MARKLIVLGAALLLVLTGGAGCRSCNRGGGGCGGGCCRSANPETPARPGPATCPVSGEELGSMGSPIPVEVNGRTVEVCCEGCVEKLKRHPERYLACERADPSNR